MTFPAGHSGTRETVPASASPSGTAKESHRPVDEPPVLSPPGSRTIPKSFRHSLVTRRRLLVVSSLLAALLIFIVLMALALGSEPLAPGVILRRVVARVLGQAEGHESVVDMILFRVRLPRIALGIVAGASLSVAGAVLQALLRNPLAEPYVLGISSGAALGAILSLIGLEVFPWARPLSAFAGAALTTLVVYGLSRGKTGITTERLILAGVIVATFLWSVIALLLATWPDPRLRGITFWLMGSVSGGGDGLLGLITPVLVLTIIGAFLCARQLNVLLVGEEDARLLGVNVERVKTVAYVLASVLAGVTVSVTGAIGFVGLIVPHLVRLRWGSDNRLVIPAAALTGAIFIVAADTLARTVIAPRELPVGAVTALIGAPVFVYLLRKA